MLDAYVRPIIDRPLNRIGKHIAATGISANTLTLIGFVFGLIAILLIGCHQLPLAAVFISLNRLTDGLDGAVARHSQLSDFGGFLDIVCDFIIYSGIVFAFGLANPNNLLYAAFLILSFIGPMTTFLAYAIIASKRNLTSERRGQKSFYYLGGICEGTETAVLLMLFCFIPQHFNNLCVGFGILCWITALGRIYNAWTDFADNTLAH